MRADEVNVCDTGIAELFPEVGAPAGLVRGVSRIVLFVAVAVVVVMWCGAVCTIGKERAERRAGVLGRVVRGKEGSLRKKLQAYHSSAYTAIVYEKLPRSNDVQALIEKAFLGWSLNTFAWPSFSLPPLLLEAG